MSVSGMQFALVSSFLSLAAWGVYWRLIFKMRVPRKPRGLQKKLGPAIRLLRDEDLKLIKMFGVRHEKGLAPTSRERARRN